jgi:hypothetical protein
MAVGFAASADIGLHFDAAKEFIQTTSASSSDAV